MKRENSNLQAKLKPRKERRLDAKANGVAFEPHYTQGLRADGAGRKYKVGGKPRTYAEAYGHKQGEKPAKEATQ